MGGGRGGKFRERRWAARHLVRLADEHEEAVVIAFAGRRVLVDDEDLGTRAQLQRLQVTPALAEDTTDDALLNQDIVADVQGGLLRAMALEQHEAFESIHEETARRIIEHYISRFVKPSIRRRGERRITRREAVASLFARGAVARGCAKLCPRADSSTVASGWAARTR